MQILPPTAVWGCIRASLIDYAGRWLTREMVVGLTASSLLSQLQDMQCSASPPAEAGVLLRVRSILSHVPRKLRAGSPPTIKLALTR